MVARGKFFLYDNINPPLDAGSYRLTSKIDMEAEKTEDASTEDFETPIADHTLHFNISAPRIKLPPDQVLTTFPPASSEGAYESRLPQIVIRKRSLPWERAAGTPGDTHHGQVVRDVTPWLALVIIAEAEGNIVNDVDAAECFTPGVTVTGAFDTPKGSYLNVPASTVQKVFPTVDDLILLTHVREVNPEDTENAMGDDDGFMAVVIGNRTPEYDEVNCQPRKYMACLINLEGQLGTLPKPLPPASDFNILDFFTNAAMETYQTSVRSGAAVPLTVTDQPRELDRNDRVAMTDAVRRGDVIFHDGLLVDRMSATPSGGLTVLGALDEASFLDGDFRRLEPIAEDISERPMAVEGVFGSFNFPLQNVVKEKFFRFPVLTSWKFTCTGAGSFRQLMEGLDVGLMGTKTPGAFARQTPPCTPEPQGDPEASDVPATSVLPLEIAETGHIGMPHLTRTGVEENAWYRGPFSPFQLHRDPVEPSAQFPKLAHVSDHLRMMTPDGREDVSLAVAFETGRLLAMSQPSFLVAVHRWRQSRFAGQFAEVMQRDMFARESDLLARLRTDFDRDRIWDAIRGGEIMRLMESGLLGNLGQQPDIGIALPRGPVDPGRVAPALDRDATRLLADGLGIPHSVVADIARNPTDRDAFSNLAGIDPGAVATDEVDLGPGIDASIDDVLDTGLRDIADITVGGVEITPQAVDGIKHFRVLQDLEADFFDGDR